MKIGILYSRTDRATRGEERDLISDNDILNTVREVTGALSGEHEAIPVRVTDDLFRVLRRESFDMVFNLCESFEGDPHGESWVAGYLEMLKIPYTGSGPFSLALCLDKARTKQMLGANDIPTPDHQVFHATSQKLDPDLRFPLIVKPLHEDASVGIDESSVVKNKVELFRRIDRIIETYRQPAIVEEFIDGREINVALMGTYPDLEVLPLSEIIFEEGANIVSFDAKWEEDSAAYRGTKGVCPARLGRELEMKVIRIAKEAYRTCGLRDYGRIDIRIREGRPYVLEVNPNPGIGSDSGFFRSFSATGRDYADMIRSVMGRCARRCSLGDLSLSTGKSIRYRSEGIVLRDVAYGDLDLLLGWMNDPEISRKMDDPGAKVEREGLIRKLFLQEEDLDLVVEDEKGERIGFCSIYDISEWNGTCEISYLIGNKDARGKGYGREMVRGLLEICRTGIGANRVIARVLVGNERSVSLLEEEGFMEVGILRGSHVMEESSFDEHLLEKLF